MEILLIYANWCGHCQALKAHFTELDNYFNRHNVKFIKLEESEKEEEIKKYEDKYHFKNQYFPFLCVFYIDNGKIKKHELSTDILEMKKDFETLIKEVKVIEPFDNNNDNNDFTITVYYPQDKPKILNIIKKYKQIATENNITFNVNRDSSLKSPFFDCLINGENKRFYFNYDDLKMLYNLIINHKKFLGFDYLPLAIKKIITDLLNPDDKPETLTYDYQKQSRLNNNKVLKCKYTYDKNGDKMFNDCQTVY